MLEWTMVMRAEKRGVWRTPFSRLYPITDRMRFSLVRLHRHSPIRLSRNAFARLVPAVP